MIDYNFMSIMQGIAFRHCVLFTVYLSIVRIHMAFYQQLGMVQ